MVKPFVVSVEPNMVMKRKNNKQVEVQDGGKGLLFLWISARIIFAE